MIYLFLLHVLLISAGTLSLTAVKPPARSTHFYAYISLLLLIGGFLGNIYSLPLTETIVVSGGNIAYAALIMTAVMFVMVERDIFVLRRLIRLVVLVNIFKILLSLVAAHVLTAPGITNVYGTPAELFQESRLNIVIGGALIITELFVLILGFEFLKRHVTSKVVKSASYLLAFVLILLFDGLVYPLIAFGSSPEINAIVIGGLPGKMVAAAAFSVPLLLFMVFSRRAFSDYLETDMFTWKVFLLPSSAIINELASNEREMRQADRVFRAVHEGLAIVDKDGTLIRANDAFLNMVGIDDKFTGLRLPQDLFLHNDVPFSGLSLGADTDLWREEVRFGHEHEHSGILSVTHNAEALKDDSGFVWSLADITAQKTVQRELDHLARHDTLTGLSNRRALDLTLRKSKDDAVALLMIDLDHFKDVNDSYGHATGDKLLREVASRISGTVAQLHLSRTALFRVGGDEFVVLIWSSEPNTLITVQRTIADSFEQPFQLRPDIEIFMPITCGASHQTTMEQRDIFQEAGAALDEAKREERGGLRVFEERLTLSAQRRMRLSTRLHDAMNQDRLELYFQPKFDTNSGQIRGAEALARWTDNEFGVVSPAEFIPIAEESGLIYSLGTHFIRVACRALADQHARGLNPVPIAVNVSPLQVWNGDFVTTIRDALADANIPGSLLQLELTETAVLKRVQDLEPMFRAVQDLGVTLAIDDFGTGYSSLSYLTALPWNVLKIDQSFVARIAEEPATLDLTTSIVNMAKSLSLEVVAEGVETQAQRDALKSMGCDTCQGFLLSRPLTLASFEALLVERSTETRN